MLVPCRVHMHENVGLCAPPPPPRDLCLNPPKGVAWLDGTLSRFPLTSEDTVSLQRGPGRRQRQRVWTSDKHVVWKMTRDRRAIKCRPALCGIVLLPPPKNEVIASQSKHNDRAVAGWFLCHNKFFTDASPVLMWVSTSGIK